MEVEYIDDLPLLSNQIEQFDIRSLIETHFPDHGHWKGLSGGQVLFVWLLYILSESDHRLSYVEDWANTRLKTIATLLCVSKVRGIDFSDDRLGNLLDRLSDDEKWSNLEQSISKRLLKVYDLSEEQQEDTPKIIRTDSFNVPQYRQVSELFTHGYSKQRRSDQPFSKVMLSSLDPLAVPLAVDLLKGSGPDVDHYIPLIERVQSMFENTGNLYVGDSQLGSMPNRIAIQSAGDYYLCPLGKKQVSEDQLNIYLDQIGASHKGLPSLFAEANSKRKAVYFYETSERLSTGQEQENWSERRILVYSPDYAKGLVKSFTNRLAEAENKMAKLVISKKGRRNPKTLKDLHVRTAAIIKQYKVDGCFELKFKEHIEQVKVNKYKDRPDRIEKKVRLELKITRNKTVIEQQKLRLGWQVYGSNIPTILMETADLVKVYREEYRIEHLFDYLLNRHTALLPVYLKKEHRVKGLVRLLSLAMRCSMLIQYRVRSALAQRKEVLTDLYPGNKGRKTAQPTTPMILRAFRGIIAVYLTNGSIETIALNDTQTRILELLKIPESYKHTFEVLKTGFSLHET